MDTIGIGIAGGLLATVFYTLTRAVRQKSFDIGTTMLVFLAGFSIPGGVKLIRAALSGNPNDLPSSWREYMAVAGIAAIGISTHFIVQSLRNVWAKPAVGAPTTKDSDTNETAS